jgi:hypothetical protein
VINSGPHPPMSVPPLTATVNFAVGFPNTPIAPRSRPWLIVSARVMIGIDIGKNSFHLVGQGRRGALVLRQKWARGQVGARLANLPPCLIGMEACVGAHHLSQKLQAAWP